PRSGTSSSARRSRPSLQRMSSVALPAGRMAARRASRSPAGVTSGAAAPRPKPLTGGRASALGRAEPDGLHEVYFEYDDELEYIARARDADREITRWAGTTEVSFPVVVSALFDSAG